ncbi:MAG: hypothetical protein J5563_03410, partial [Clostridia bacterium]|nr:hypothetical protein [Clostridia bacterium]
DPLGTISDNPVSHLAYSYAAQVIILNEEGKIEKAVSAFDIGTPVNVQSADESAVIIAEIIRVLSAAIFGLRLTVIHIKRMQILKVRRGYPYAVKR